ncbi:hypothetical protein NKR23_g3963 [Pleurostoma richardsiae]|uniref:ferroxidase n=1 Tax=Pleurostoma richardsiae TaxID=41990 RepID=A0AA38RKW4_9PEZI|nr:hypothetical protein NKR23_g3963 [Pleurostoma richardsiae]
MTREILLSRATHVAVKRSLRLSQVDLAWRRRREPVLLSRHAVFPGQLVAGHQFLSTTFSYQQRLSPGSEDPPVSRPSHQSTIPTTPAVITEAQYHELADEYLEATLSKFEELQDEREDVDVEYAAGVLTVNFPSIGTYVINKQPPNKQIWLSSPKSGPKRYDWVIIGDGQGEKQGTGRGDWIYLRDGSTLHDLFLSEIGVDLSLPIPHSGE